MSSDGRRWLELRVRCPSGGEQSDLLADGLIAAGARGVEERGGWYVSYFDEPHDLEAFLAAVVSDIESETGLSPLRVDYDWQAHESWEESWKRGLGPRRVTERIVVHPSWAPPRAVRSTDLVIRLDPGMAFGTAEHGTTRGCLRLLDGLVRQGDRLLDVGAGSGILSIAAARLGARSVVAIEGDGYACEALRENIDANEVEGVVTVAEAWATAQTLAARGPVDGIIANIEAGLLAPLHEGFPTALAPGGWVLLSGILTGEWSESRERAESYGLVLEALDEDGDWCSGLFRRSP